MYTPNKAKDYLKKLGLQIRKARKRRMWTIADLAKKMEVSAPTVMSLEMGKPTVSVGVLATALWTLGLEKELQNLSSFNDPIGQRLMDTRLPKKVRTSKKDLDNDF